MVLVAVAVVLVIAWLVIVLIDWNHYDPTLDSAPFWAFLVVRGSVFLTPAMFFLVAGLILRKEPRYHEPG